MNKVSDFWKSHTDADGKIAWPDTPAERDRLAQAFFGLCFAEAIDYWLARADQLLDDPQPPTELLEQKAEDPTYPRAFEAMTQSERDAVRKLVRETAHGVLFSSLVNVDQVASGNFEVSMTDGRQQGRVHPAGEDLHDQLYDWIWQFSDFRNQLMEKMPRGGVRWVFSSRRREDVQSAGEN